MSLEAKILERMQTSLPLMSHDALLKFANAMLIEAWQIPNVRERIVGKLVIVVGDLPTPAKKGRKPKDAAAPAQEPPKQKPLAQKLGEALIPAKPKKPELKQPVDDSDEEILKALSTDSGDTTEEDDDNLGAIFR